MDATGESNATLPMAKKSYRPDTSLSNSVEEEEEGVEAGTIDDDLSLLMSF